MRAPDASTVASIPQWEQIHPIVVFSSMETQRNMISEASRELAKKLSQLWRQLLCFEE
jgi:hypothetical protein